MRGTVAKRLRREAFELHKNDKKPTSEFLGKIHEKLRVVTTHSSFFGSRPSQQKVKSVQAYHGRGWKKTYKELKKRHAQEARA